MATCAWSRARDVLAGEDAVKAGGERYLTRLDSQTDEEYFAYRNRASFFNANPVSGFGFPLLVMGIEFGRLPHDLLKDRVRDAPFDFPVLRTQAALNGECDFSRGGPADFPPGLRRLAVATPHPTRPAAVFAYFDGHDLKRW